MTTERSGMSLEQISNMLRRAAWDMVNPKYRKKFEDAADAIDAHLSSNSSIPDGWRDNAAQLLRQKYGMGTMSSLMAIDDIKAMLAQRDGGK